MVGQRHRRVTEFGRPDKVAVYVPQSYNFAANLILVPRQRVHFIDADAGAFMAFIVSGGVAEMSATRTTIMDLSAFRSR